MITCIDRFKKNNEVYAYRLQDKNGRTIDISAEQLKIYIRNGRFHVDNLTLTSDNRLIPKSKTPIKLGDSDLDKKIAKAKILGTYEKIEIRNAKYLDLIHISPMEHIMHIPDNVKELVKNDDIMDSLRFGEDLMGNRNYIHKIHKLQGRIKVIGGKNLVSLDNAFTGCACDYIDFTQFSTKNVESMDSTFRNCCIKKLDLSNFNTENVKSMSRMFFKCHADSINLSSFKTNNTTLLDAMFAHCTTKKIDLTSMYTNNVASMHDMFYDYSGEILTHDQRIKDVYINRKM